jgi:hypothetical protein
MAANLLVLGFGMAVLGVLITLRAWQLRSADDAALPQWMWDKPWPPRTFVAIFLAVGGAWIVLGALLVAQGLALR